MILDDRLLALLAPGGPALPPEVVAVLTDAREALREHEASELRHDALLTTIRALLDHAGVPVVGQYAVPAGGWPDQFTANLHAAGYVIPLDERVRWLISAAKLERR